jgi:hypothetical protein
MESAGLVSSPSGPEFAPDALPPLSLLPRQPFVIDLTRLEPVLRRRRPEAFW